MTDNTANTDDHATEGIKQPFWLLKAATAKKLGKHSEGCISYRILSDTDRKHLYLSITGNDGGGYVSREMLPFHKVEACITKQDQQLPFPSKSLKEVFIGRSSNNAAFLATILRAENLLTAAPANELQHLVSANWPDWKKSMLSVTGIMIEIDSLKPKETPASADSASDHTEHTEKRKTLTLRRNKSAD